MNKVKQYYIDTIRFMDFISDETRQKCMDFFKWYRRGLITKEELTRVIVRELYNNLYADNESGVI